MVKLYRWICLLKGCTVISCSLNDVVYHDIVLRCAKSLLDVLHWRNHVIVYHNASHTVKIRSKIAGAFEYFITSNISVCKSTSINRAGV